MNPKLFTIVPFLLSIIAVCGCGKPAKEVKQEYMAFDDVRYAGELRTLATLKADAGEEVALPEISIRNFAIVDSLLFVETGDPDGLLDVLRVGGNQVLRSFFKRGNGEYEFPYGLSLSLQSTFAHERDSLVLFICNDFASRMYRVNITQSLRDKKTCVCDITPESKLKNPVFWGKVLDGSSLLTRSLDEMETSQKRQLYRNGKAEDCKLLEKLNAFEVPQGEDFNILSSLAAVSPDGKWCAEAPTDLNYINVYSLSQNEGYTVCIDKEMDKLSDIVNTTRGNRKYLFADVRAYGFGFAALCYDTTKETFLRDKPHASRILLFGWDGNALGQVTSDMPLCHFDIDAKREQLYVQDNDGRLFRFPLSPTFTTAIR